VESTAVDRTGLTPTNADRTSADPTGAERTGVVRVLLVDEHALFREGLGLALTGIDDIEVAGEAVDGDDAAVQSELLRPDVVVMDVRMPEGSGAGAIARIRAAQPDVAVLVLTGSAEDDDLVDSLRAGATGYLLKDASVDEVAEAIRGVARGQGALSAMLTAKVLERLGELLRRVPDDDGGPRLTGRELDVLRLVVKGLTNREIARDLFISQNTVKNHVRNILEKLHVRSRTEAATLAVRERLLDAQ
jgi:DNA-binding NarL/FixJ family response regulator